MDPTRHMTRSPTETDLMETISKYCEINQKQEVSLTSLLQYIKEEIEVKFVDSQSVVKQLTGSLQCESKNGWINFDSIYKIFESWLNQQSSMVQFSIIKPIAQTSDASTSTLSPDSQITSTTLIHNKMVFKGAHDRLLEVESISSACNGCGRDRSCCEFRNDVESENRNEKKKIHYDQKIATLRALLDESEEFNTMIQNEMDSLRKICNDLKVKERCWQEKERQYKEHEQQLTMMNNLLKEKNSVIVAEIQQLRNQLSRSENEPKYAIFQPSRLETRGTTSNETERLLFETKQKLSRKDLEIQNQNLLLQEREEKIHQLEQQNEDFQKLLHSLEKRKSSKEDMCDVLLSPIKLDLSTQEELFATPPIINRYLNVSPSTKAIAEVLSLKAELEAVFGVGPASQEHASTQTSFIITAGDVSMEASICATDKNVTAQYAHFISQEKLSLQTDNSMTFKNISTQTPYFMDYESMLKERIINLAIICNQNDCLKCYTMDREMNISQKEINNCNNTDKSESFRFCSTYEIELFEVIDVSTQIEFANKN